MNVLEELTEFEPQIDKRHVERRVRDWEQRVLDLYGNILRWLPTGWTGATQGAVPLDDELMQKFQIDPRPIPLLLMNHVDGETARVEPRGLWIIGANGRLDLIRPTAHYVINDRADNFDTPDWRIAELRQRQMEKILDQVSLAESLA